MKNCHAGSDGWQEYVSRKISGHLVCWMDRCLVVRVSTKADVLPVPSSYQEYVF